ncbi:glycosyltransferase family 2 protein [Pseudomonas sp. NPDC089395]|uniref:glycosyltransferase family 2 protein n=1 Tax=Pseudomonas sp. NPDC089395 TaxID=3364460 RepID=UPI00382A165B
MRDPRLTLVLLTHDQPAALRRALAFYRSHPFDILVLDSSAQPSKGLVEQEAQVDYRHLPGVAGNFASQKLAYAAASVGTPYVVFVTDGDFLALEALERCLAFLEQNLDYGYCQGYGLMYSARGAMVEYAYRDRKGQQDFGSDDAETRLDELASHFLPAFHAVTRTDLLQRWQQVAPNMGPEFATLGHTIYLLANAKARVLPVAYGARKSYYPDNEPEAGIQVKLARDTQADKDERNAFVQQMAEVLPGLGPVLASRNECLQRVLNNIEGCLRDRVSLAHERIVSAHYDWREGVQFSFSPTQFVEMPFYNEAFFTILERIGFLLQSLPADRAHLQSLEPILLNQQELARVRRAETEDDGYWRVQQAFEAHPFNVELARRLLAHLLEQPEQQYVAQLQLWIQRLEQVQPEGWVSALQDTLSGRLHARFHAWNPTPSQQNSIAETFKAHQGGPVIGLVVLDLDDDLDKLQLTLDSILESYYTRYQIVVLTTARPPVVTRESDRLHFVHVQRVGWTKLLSELMARANWDWMLRIEVGVCLSPSGLLKVALQLLDAGECRAVYCDELQRLPSGTLTSLFRPSFNLDLLLSSPVTMACHWLVRRDVFLSLGGYDAHYSQAMEFDLILRMIECGAMSGIGHIDELLLVCDEDRAEHNQDELNTLRRHLNVRGYERATVLQNRPRAYHVRYVHAERPLVSIIIPTRDQFGLVSRCVETIIQRTRYKHYEIILVDNLSEAEDAKGWLDAIESMADDKLRVLRYPHPFNYSAMNNLAVAEARGEYLVLMNNDTAVIDDNWLDELLNHAQRPEVGIVGARLHYPDGTLQHAGVVLGLRGPAEHPWLRRAPQAPSYMGRSQLDQNFSAVTAACLMIRKKVYEQVDGLDEVAFAVSYNDVDLCLKVGQAGYLNVWASRSVVMHEGSVSQATVDPLSVSAKRLRFVGEQDAFYARWMPILINDPAYNRNLSLSGNGFEIDDKPLIEADLRDRPLVLMVALPGQRVELAQAWEALGREACVAVVHQRLQIADLLRTAPDVLVIPGAMCQLDSQTLGHYQRYFPGLKILDLCALDQLGWEQGDGLPDHITQTIRLVDRVLVADESAAQALAGLHADIHVVPAPLEFVGSTKRSSSEQGGLRERPAAILAACLA